MSTQDRWLQRLQNLQRAFKRLEDACDRETYTDLELAGLIQTYEFTFELTWKTMKDRLLYEGFDVNSPRATILQAFQSAFVSNVDIWLEALETRNIFSHAYRTDIAEEAALQIKEKFHPMIAEALVHLNQIAADT